VARQSASKSAAVSKENGEMMGDSFDNALTSKQLLVVTVFENMYRGKMTDNYTYLICDLETKTAAVIDPVDPEKLIAKAEELGVTINSVFTTHSHSDHDGGNEKIAELIPGITIYGGKGDGVSACTKEVEEGDAWQLGSLNVSIIATPCHTPGHVCYLVTAADSPPAVFTGDTLFVGGCGNFNDGTPQLMHDAFVKLAALPPSTLVYVGHEYTVSNLQYAAFVQPDSFEVAKKLAWAKTCCSAGGFTVPSTIGEELATNPFMRAVTKQEEICQHCDTEDPVEAIAFVRKEKSAGNFPRP
jgi:hydroxyacylglutathione hydrolase